MVDQSFLIFTGKSNVASAGIHSYGANNAQSAKSRQREYNRHSPKKLFINNL